MKQKTNAFLEILHSRQAFVLMIPSHFLPAGILLDQEGREDEFSRINPSALICVLKATSAGFGDGLAHVS